MPLPRIITRAAEILGGALLGALAIQGGGATREQIIFNPVAGGNFSLGPGTAEPKLNAHNGTVSIVYGHYTDFNTQTGHTSSAVKATQFNWRNDILTQTLQRVLDADSTGMVQYPEITWGTDGGWTTWFRELTPESVKFALQKIGFDLSPQQQASFNVAAASLNCSAPARQRRAGFLRRHLRAVEKRKRAAQNKRRRTPADIDVWVDAASVAETPSDIVVASNVATEAEGSGKCDVHEMRLRSFHKQTLSQRYKTLVATANFSSYISVSHPKVIVLANGQTQVLRFESDYSTANPTSVLISETFDSAGNAVQRYQSQSLPGSLSGDFDADYDPATGKIDIAAAMENFNSATFKVTDTIDAMQVDTRNGQVDNHVVLAETSSDERKLESFESTVKIERVTKDNSNGLPVNARVISWYRDIEDLATNTSTGSGHIHAVNAEFESLGDTLTIPETPGCSLWDTQVRLHKTAGDLIVANSKYCGKLNWNDDVPDLDPAKLRTHFSIFRPERQASTTGTTNAPVDPTTGKSPVDPTTGRQPAPVPKPVPEVSAADSSDPGLTDGEKVGVGAGVVGFLACCGLLMYSGRKVLRQANSDYTELYEASSDNSLSN